MSRLILLALLSTLATGCASLQHYGPQLPIQIVNECPASDHIIASVSEGGPRLRESPPIPYAKKFPFILEGQYCDNYDYYRRDYYRRRQLCLNSQSVLVQGYSPDGTYLGSIERPYVITQNGARALTLRIDRLEHGPGCAPTRRHSP